MQYKVGLRIAFVVSACLLAEAAPSRAGVVSYTDENGNMFFSDQDAAFFSKPAKKGASGNGDNIMNNSRYAATIYAAGKANNLDPDLIRCVISAESDFDRFAVSSKGAHGLMQLTIPTAYAYAVRDVYDPVENIHGGAKLLKHLIEKFHGDLRLVLAAYNAGESNVIKYSGVPPFPETINYVKKVLHNYKGSGRIYAFAPVKNARIFRYENVDGTVYVTDTPRNMDDSARVWPGESR